MPALRVKLGSRVFAPSLVPTLAVLPLLALLASLGTWQMNRAGEKRELFEGFARGTTATRVLPAEAPTERYAHVRTSGRYVADRQFLLDNMTHDGRAGFRVLTPLRRAEGATVLVDRGWVPLVDGGRRVLPEVAVADVPRSVAGRADALPRPGLQIEGPAGSGWPRVLSFPRLETLERELGEPLHPQIVLLDPELPDGFVRAWQPPGLPPERHVGYAVQWYGLAVTLLALYVFVNLKRAEDLP